MSSNVIPLWKRRLDKIREKFPDFMPLAFGKLGVPGVTHVLIGGDEVPWEEYCKHVGIEPRLEDRYP